MRFWDSSALPNAPDDTVNGVPAEGPNSLPIHKYDPALGRINIALWADPVEVSYQFQMNRPNDVVKIDYLTRELMSLAFQVRLYDPSSGRPQITELSNKIKVRNLQR